LAEARKLLRGRVDSKEHQHIDRKHITVMLIFLHLYCTCDELSWHHASNLVALTHGGGRKFAQPLQKWV